MFLSTLASIGRLVSGIAVFEATPLKMFWASVLACSVVASPSPASAKNCVLAYIIYDLGSVCVDIDSIRKDQAGLTHFDVYSPQRIRNGATTYAVNCSQDLSVKLVSARFNPAGLERGTKSTAQWQRVDLRTDSSHQGQPGLVKLACRVKL